MRTRCNSAPTRLRLTPIERAHADELWELHQDPGVAAWYGGSWSRDEAAERAARMGEGWRADAPFALYVADLTP